MRKTIPLQLILVLYAATVFFNIHLRSNVMLQGRETDLIQRMFGGLRVFVGDWAFMKAEEYHHKGLPFMKAMAYHGGESFAGEEAAGHDHEHEHGDVQEVSGDWLYSRIYKAVNVTEDSHMKPSEEKEVLPWFYVEVAFNPHDIRGYVLGGYWLQRIGRREESMKFLEEGQANNPASAQIIGYIGELYRQDREYNKAIEYLEASRKKWLEGKGPNNASDGYAKSDRFFAFGTLAGLYFYRGDYAKALKVYKEMEAFGPNAAVSEKIAEIEGLLKRSEPKDGLNRKP